MTEVGTIAAPHPTPSPDVEAAGLGIRSTYARLPLGSKLRAYVAAARPFTLLAVLVGVSAATAMAVAYGVTSWTFVAAEWRHLLYGAVTLLLVVVGGNFVNQATDLEDTISKRYRPVVRGFIGREEASTIGHLMWFVAILRAATMGPVFGILVTALVATSYAYSSPPLRLKAIPWGGNVAVALARGFLGFLAAWSLWGNPLDPRPWVAGGILTVFLVGATTAKDFADEAGDRAHGVRNLVVKYGPRRAAWLSLPFILSPILLLPIAQALGWLVLQPVAYFGAAMVVLIFAYHFIYHHGQENQILEGNKPWVWMYFSLLALQAVFASAAFGLA